MQYGFIKTAAFSPAITVADCRHNAYLAVESIKEAAKKGASLVVLPRLYLTGATCASLFSQKRLTSGATQALLAIAKDTAKCDCVSVIGLPMLLYGKLYDCAAVVCRGEIIGITCAENPEAPFAKGENTTLSLGDGLVPMGPDLVYRCENMPDFCFSVEIEEEVSKAPLTVHLSSQAETVFSPELRLNQVKARTKATGGAIVYCNAGEGESTTDGVCSGARLIAEEGIILAESAPFFGGAVVSDIDTELISRNVPIYTGNEVLFKLAQRQTVLTRTVEKDPFCPAYAKKDAICRRAFEIQARGLARRAQHTGAKALVLGVSGGLDSTIALLVCIRVCEILKKETSFIRAVTMPCFGTSSRTKSNAEKLCELLNVPLLHIDITDAVTGHFKDIGHDGKTLDAAFENSQARERTQVLMDLSNMLGGFVVGTGDLSELALGWATYNGDHMSAYAVNADLPKTFIRHEVEFIASHTDHMPLREVLRDIAATPVSPELLPISGESSDQKTEDIVGPYELHDFFLWNIVRQGFTPEKTKYLALNAFKGEYSEETVDKWIKIFMRRFFSQQFKRSCMPDGPAVFDFSLSPRAGFNFPSDASSDLWR